MQRVPNMGSVLQAYGLKKMLESQGHRVEFIDIKAMDEDLNLHCEIEEKNDPTVVISNKYFINRVIHKFEYKKQEKLFMDFMNANLKLNHPSSIKKYDVCVIGSDEVFNCLNIRTIYGFTSQLFGNVDCADRVITYAASCGSTDIAHVPQKMIERIKTSFSNIKAFSVRDNNTFKFVNELTGIEPSINLDPVLVNDFSKEGENVKYNISKLPSHMCVIYAYGNRISNPDEIKNILNFCNEYSLEPVAVGSPQFWIRRFLPLHPFQISQVFSKAEFIITDTFHGTIFSYKYAPKFAIFVRPSNYNKLMDLAVRLKIVDHVVAPGNSLESISRLKKDRKAIDDYLLSERNKSMKYLRENI